MQLPLHIKYKASVNDFYQDLASLILYDAGTYREQLFKLNIEYIEYLRNAAAKNLGVSGLFRNPIEYVRSIYPESASATPFEGVIYLLVIGENAVGMGELRRLEEGVGEIRRMFIRPEYRGRGYGREIMSKLFEKARGLGYYTIRLSTVNFLEASVHIYRSAGFVERDRYQGAESNLGPHYIYMEKKL